MKVVVAVGEVEAGDIHAGADQLADGCGRSGSGSEGGDDLDLPHNLFMITVNIDAGILGLSPPDIPGGGAVCQPGR
jgi:hypothetical protein